MSAEERELDSVSTEMMSARERERAETAFSLSDTLSITLSQLTSYQLSDMPLGSKQSERKGWLRLRSLPYIISHNLNVKYKDKREAYSCPCTLLRSSRPHQSSVLLASRDLHFSVSVEQQPSSTALPAHWSYRRIIFGISSCCVILFIYFGRQRVTAANDPTPEEVRYKEVLEEH
jgi:hypothetical protein